MAIKTRTKRFVPKRQPKPLSPTKPSQAKYAEKFREKNARRKRAKATFPSDYRIGRRNRAQLALGGCFGHKKAEIHNQCVIGTFGFAKNDEDEEQAA